MWPPASVTSCDTGQCAQHPRDIISGHKRNQQGKVVLTATEEVAWKELDCLDSNPSIVLSRPVCQQVKGQHLTHTEGSGLSNETIESNYSNP